MKKILPIIALVVLVIPSWGKQLTEGEYREFILNEIKYLCRKDLDLSEKTEERINYLIIDRFRQKTKLMLMERDLVARPYVVNFQKAFEEFLVEQFEEGKVKNIVCIIHAARPATPLCNPRGKLIKETVHDSVIHNPEVLLTILKREDTLRDLLKHATVYITYPKGGFKARSAHEQSVYREEVENPDNANLRDVELFSEEIPAGMSGATYAFETRSGKRYVFAMSGSQVVDSDTSIWNLWLGPRDDSTVSSRVQDVLDYHRLGGLKLDI